MIIQTQAYARAGLIGNPSDGYFGKTISIICRNHSARVSLYESPRLYIRPQHCDRLEYGGVNDLINDVGIHGYYGGIRLIKATIKRFSDHCAEHGHTIEGRNFTIEYDTDIPVRVGMAGSSAIVTATMRALMSFFEVDIPKVTLPNLILGVEVEELGISAGLQDRVVQVYEGTVFMDFNRAWMFSSGHGRYESIDSRKLPPLFVAYHNCLAEGTEVSHSDLRDRYDRGDEKVHKAMDEFAEFAQKARDLIDTGNGMDIGPLMTANFDLRSRLVRISEGNRKLVQIGRDHGAATKFAGSGGAAIGCYDGDPERLARIRADYEEFGATMLVPEINEGARITEISRTAER